MSRPHAVRFLSAVMLAMLASLSARAGYSVSVESLNIRVLDSHDAPVEGAKFLLYGVLDRTSMGAGCLFPSGAMLGGASLFCVTNERTAAQTISSDVEGRVTFAKQTFVSLAPWKRNLEIYLVYDGEGNIPDCGLNSFRSASTGQLITERVMRLDRNHLDELRDVEIVCRTNAP